MSAAKVQTITRVQPRPTRERDRARERMVGHSNRQTDSASHLYHRLFREMDRAQKAYLSIVEEEDATHTVSGRVDAAYQRFEVATRAFNYFLKATAA